MINDGNKALKAQAKADRDIWESRYVCSGRQKKVAKRSFKRSQRRLDKALIAEQQDAA